ncbi:DDE-type integrase/transposase/recombinase [Rhodococcus erythropolis]|uniref:DDE-type integrase/transposase/recombinase n=1 Tax=Rhodococcus erythropolis TaxID=1833 RepID=UPI0039828491
MPGASSQTVQPRPRGVGEAAENLLNRQFAAETAHTKWATDVTEFNIGSSKVYLLPILDLHDSRIIAAASGPSPSVKMVTDSLRMVIDTLNAGEKPLVHSDQGFQYCHTLWRDTVREQGSPSRCPAKDALRQRRHGGILQPPQGGMVPHPEIRNSRRVSRSAH